MCRLLLFGLGILVMKSLNISRMGFSCFGSFRPCKDDRGTQVQGKIFLWQLIELIDFGNIPSIFIVVLHYVCCCCCCFCKINEHDEFFYMYIFSRLELKIFMLYPFDVKFLTWIILYTSEFSICCGFCYFLFVVKFICLSCKN